MVLSHIARPILWAPSRPQRGLFGLATKVSFVEGHIGVIVHTQEVPVLCAVIEQGLELVLVLVHAKVIRQDLHRLKVGIGKQYSVVSVLPDGGGCGGDKLCCHDVHGVEMARGEVVAGQVVIVLDQVVHGVVPYHEGQRVNRVPAQVHVLSYLLPVHYLLQNHGLVAIKYAGLRYVALVGSVVLGLGEYPAPWVDVPIVVEKPLCEKSLPRPPLSVHSYSLVGFEFIMVFIAKVVRVSDFEVIHHDGYAVFLVLGVVPLPLSINTILFISFLLIQ